MNQSFQHFVLIFCIYNEPLFFIFRKDFVSFFKAFFKPFLLFLIISSWGIVRTVGSMDQPARWKTRHQYWNKFLSNEKNGSCWQDYKVLYGILAASLFYLIMAIYYLFDWCCINSLCLSLQHGGRGVGGNMKGLIWRHWMKSNV